MTLMAPVSTTPPQLRMGHNPSPAMISAPLAPEINNSSTLIPIPASPELKLDASDTDTRSESSKDFPALHSRTVSSSSESMPDVKEEHSSSSGKLFSSDSHPLTPPSPVQVPLPIETKDPVAAAKAAATVAFGVKHEVSPLVHSASGSPPHSRSNSSDSAAASVLTSMRSTRGDLPSFTSASPGMVPVPPLAASSMNGPPWAVLPPPNGMAVPPFVMNPMEIGNKGLAAQATDANLHGPTPPSPPHRAAQSPPKLPSIPALTARDQGSAFCTRMAFPPAISQDLHETATQIMYVLNTPGMTTDFARNLLGRLSNATQHFEGWLAKDPSNNAFNGASQLAHKPLATPVMRRSPPLSATAQNQNSLQVAIQPPVQAPVPALQNHVLPFPTGPVSRMPSPQTAPSSPVQIVDHGARPQQHLIPSGPHPPPSLVYPVSNQPMQAQFPPTMYMYPVYDGVTPTGPLMYGTVPGLGMRVMNNGPPVHVRAPMTGVPSPQSRRCRKRVRKNEVVQCRQCGTYDTPEWRRGPDGARTLCNACGLYHAKLAKKRGEAEAAELLRERSHMR